MPDKYTQGPQSVSAPAVGAKVITPADGTDIANSKGDYPTAVYLAAAGAFSYTDLYGNVIVITALGAGWHPLRASTIEDTGTDATEVLTAWQADPEA